MMNPSFMNKMTSLTARCFGSLIILMACITACEDNTSQIGPILADGETAISIDSISYNLDAKSIEYNNFDSRTGYLLLGNLNVKEYGALDCSFVTRLMCATEINVPDSLLNPERVDSCRLALGIAQGDLVGDSLTPQKVAAFMLNKQLPSGITNTFNPEGYYDQSNPLGTKSFTASLIARSDSALIKSGAIYIEVPVDKELGKKVFTEYKEHPETFQWPQTFAQFFPGLYVNSFFGKGCVANVQRIYFNIYYHKLVDKTTVVDGDSIKTQIHSPLSVCPFTSSAEVLSSNNISYKVSDYLKNMAAAGENIITTPGGYLINLKFPAEELIAKYNGADHNLSMVNNLTISIPAEGIDNDYGIGITPTLLMIKSSEMEEFFANNKLPDNKTSFTATYNSLTKKYTFSSMRQYILDMIEKGNITDDDTDFTIIPVTVTEEQNTTNYYYGTTATYVTKCTPYASKPTMTRMHTEDATIVFTFSSQYIK